MLLILEPLWLNVTAETRTAKNTKDYGIFMYMISTNGLFGSLVGYSSVRPSISLKLGTLVYAEEDVDGSLEHPYVVVK